MADRKDWLQKKINQIGNKKVVEALTLCNKYIHDFALDILVQYILDLEAKNAVPPKTV